MVYDYGAGRGEEAAKRVKLANVYRQSAPIRKSEAGYTPHGSPTHLRKAILRTVYTETAVT